MRSFAVLAIPVSGDCGEQHLFQRSRKDASDQGVLDESPASACGRNRMTLDLDEVWGGGETHTALEVSVERPDFGTCIARSRL